MPTSAWSSRYEKIFSALAICAILGLAAYLRLVNLRNSPGWYSDEGNFISYAAHQSQGRWQIFALADAPMQIQRPPLFLFLLAGAFKIWGVDILVLRQLTAICGVVSVGLLYALGRKMFDERLALFSAGLLAINPWAVAYSRIGLTYNLLTPLLLLTLYAGWQFIQSRRAGWAWGASIAAGLAFGTDYLGVVVVLLVAAIFLMYRPRWLLPGALLMSLTVGLILAPVILSNVPGFVRDLTGTLPVRAGDASLPLQIVNGILNYSELLRRESWIVVGLCGLFLLPRRGPRAQLLFLVGVTLLIVARVLPLVGRCLHYLIQLFPLFVLGLAVFIEKAASLALGVMEDAGASLTARLAVTRGRVWRLGQKVIISLALFAVIGSPLMWMLFASMAQSVYGLPILFTGGDDLNLTDAQDASQVQAYINARTSAGDLVVASPQIVWGMAAQQAMFWDLWPQDPSLQPYAVSLPRATFVVLDPLARDFAPRVLPGMQMVITEVETWPVAFEAGDVRVYQNPARP